MDGADGRKLSILRRVMARISQWMPKMETRNQKDGFTMHNIAE
jgi:hypothetical protein